MPTDSKSRMISFRLTPQEHESFRQICFERGMQSLSEMARAGLKLMKTTQPADGQADTFELRLSEIENRLQMLFLEVRRLSGNTNTMMAPTAEHSLEHV